MKILDSTKKKVAAATVAAVVIAGSGVAFAYWTAEGTGSGQATVGTDNGVSIENVAFDGNLYPGHSVTVTFDIENLSADTAVKVDKVIADVSQGTNGISDLPANCLAADFHFAEVVVNSSIAESATIQASGTLSMDNTAINQNACKGVTPTLNLVTDNSGI